RPREERLDGGAQAKIPAHRAERDGANGRTGRVPFGGGQRLVGRSPANDRGDGAGSLRQGLRAWILRPVAQVTAPNIIDRSSARGPRVKSDAGRRCPPGRCKVSRSR